MELGDISSNDHTHPLRCGIRTQNNLRIYSKFYFVLPDCYLFRGGDLGINGLNKF